MMKEWQSRGVIRQVFPKSSWEQDSWGEREGEIVYKGRGGVIEGEFIKIERKDLEKNERKL